MQNTSWILLDTETNGLKTPIYVVEIGAQKMLGWTPDGPPFRRLINQNADIPPEASRVHGYTREILERDGEEPHQVYREFAAYAGTLPLVSYNLSYDLDQVLLPEWQRLGIAEIGRRGFCALELARRLLDPVPAGNCKLQTLRQYYRLPGGGAHTALGDVQTVVDLLQQVLRPLAEARQIHTWQAVEEFCQKPWFPTLIAFGKFKGRDYRDAQIDDALRDWLHWLAESSNKRSASMGRWYLEQLESAGPYEQVLSSPDINHPISGQTSTDRSVVVYLAPELAAIQALIAAARNRLVEVETQYTEERHAVDVVLARLFQTLKPQYQRRDRLKLAIDYRRRFLDTLLSSGDEAAEQVTQTHNDARQQSDAEYEKASADASTKQALSEDEAKELKTLWRKLVGLFHPDRFMDDPQKRLAYEWLTAEINHARERGDIQRLREIAQDPEGFLSRNGMLSSNFDDSTDLVRLRRLFDALQQRILEALEALNDLHDQPGYELHIRSSENDAYFDGVIVDHANALEIEIAEMEQASDLLKKEIEGLTDTPGPSEDDG